MPLDTRFHPEQIHPSVFIAPGAAVVGDVTLGAQASVNSNAISTCFDMRSPYQISLAAWLKAAARAT